MSEETLLPLFPLPDVVHFPRTELRLHVSEPRYCRLLRDLEERDEESRWIGVVLLKPGWVQSYEGNPEIFPGGTAGRLMDIEELPDGSANVLLYGDFRFELERECAGEPYRQAVVRPVAEPWLNERDAGIVVVRESILTNVRSLAAELGESFPLGSDEIEECEESPFEELVNRIAAEIDVPVLRKLQLLVESLPERGLSVLSILRSRKQVVDQLRPYRHLADRSHLN
ncbi:MAG TPA: LON peptidase substrate-binding domain-containing protein [Thermoanaerobaculia bacterium]|nr:LON peptidase substrate-binding domain-containing protein [Thermoanaerobaculia bacterium]